MLPSLDALRRHLETQFTEDAVVLGPTVDLGSALGLAESMRVIRPSLAVILVRRRVDTSVLTDALRSGRVRGGRGARPRRSHLLRTPRP